MSVTCKLHFAIADMNGSSRLLDQSLVRETFYF